MPVQLLRRVRTRQPSTSVKIDFANPITKGLSGVIRLDACAEVVKGKLYTATGTKLQRSSVGTGRGFGSTDGAGTTDKVLTDIVGTQGPRTYFVLAKLNGFGGGNLGRFFDGTTTSQELFYVSNAGNGGLIYWRQFSGGSRTALTVDASSVSNQFGKITSYSVSFDASSPSNQPELYIAGTRYAFVSLDGVPTGTANSTGAFYIGNRGTDNLRNTDGTIYLVLVFDRMLSAAEHKSLTENPWQVFAQETVPLFWPGVTAQFSRPTSDASTGTWTASTGSDLYAMIDETVASDTDYISTVNASTCEVALSTLSDPASSSGHIVRYRLSAEAGGVTVRLRQGTTTIASWTHSPAPSSLTTYAQTLSVGEADSITDYTALKLQFEATE